MGAKTIRALGARAICYRPYGRIISSKITDDGFTIIEIEGLEFPMHAPDVAKEAKFAEETPQKDAEEAKPTQK